METWLIVLISLCCCLFIKLLFSLLKPAPKLPPGPPFIPLIGTLQRLPKSVLELEGNIRNLSAKLGPIITFRIGSRHSIFVTDHSLTHQALVQQGAIFADRPPPLVVQKITSSNQHSINAAFYGPNWRLFRKNLSSEILHPLRIKSYSQARQWVLEMLINRLKKQSETGEHVIVKEHFDYTMFSLLVLMCFGDKLDEEKIKDVQRVQHNLLVRLYSFNRLNFLPSLTRIFLHKKWQEFYKLQQDKENVLIPLIRARQSAKLENLSKDREDKKGNQGYIISYVDTLLDLQLPNGNRKLEEKEIVSLCSEFLDAGTDTTSTALQWILANLVKCPHIQDKLFLEIKGVVSPEAEEVKEEDLQKMPYLKAVILEGLRRHPPGHFLLPHAVTQDTVLDGFMIPKNGTINFMIAQMGLDPKVWKNPMEFNPNRFLTDDNGLEGFDVTGSREVKMLPFGVGRRICPGHGLAMLHLEYFLANLVWNFKWMAVEGDDIDLSEKQEFTVVMKHPLKACISERNRD